MYINTMTVKFLNQKIKIYRVSTKEQGVLKVFETEQEALQFIAENA